MSTDPPSQSHSDTSVAAALSIKRTRVLGQERFVYESLQKASKPDWRLWEAAKDFPKLFDKLSSLHRARVGLVWVNRTKGATLWHPVEDSGRRVIDPKSGKSTNIWRIKARYRGVPYDEWALKYRGLAKGKPQKT